MSEFKDFLDQIKVRLTNPLLFSFLISWMVIHWQIFVGAFYLSQKELERLGHSNFLDFVKAKIDWFNSLLYPLLSAINRSQSRGLPEMYSSVGNDKR